ncbi:MAG TPA: ABC transporter ATP-binding protein [Bryobacteraceae bacterium]|nr:ABC transporter ATP-binding protein [Bryobacteraceae bacterium]
MSPRGAKPPGAAGLLGLLKPYSGLIALLLAMTIIANSLTLAVPRLISHAIDTFGKPGFALGPVVLQFAAVAILIFLFTYGQSIAQTYASEKVAKDLRSRLAGKISVQTYEFVERVSPAKLLTNLTSDVDAVKLFVSQAVASIISSVFVILGASALLLSINWRLGLCILAIIPVIGITLSLALSKVRKLFRKGQETIDWLNRVINESILGSALIRILSSQHIEFEKFSAANTQSLGIGLSILRLFAGLIPIITLAANLATFTILLLGGHFVIAGSMSLGDFTAFNSYLSILIFPLMVLGFMSNVIAQSSASYARLGMILAAKEEPKTGTLTELKGDIAVDNVTLAYGEKKVLKDVSFAAPAGSNTAIIGPTAAGKTQLLYLLIGLLKPTAGAIRYDGEPLEAWDADALHRQVGFVFQDSVLFNLTLRENIAFSSSCDEASLERAIRAAELEDFIATLPEGLDTVVSERGASLSGGQKQRVMLARALALNPKVLLLDDFTARVDSNTEQKILRNVRELYPGITLISVTQKISSVEHFDQIVLLMEGEVLATGTHAELMETSPEYVQIWDSQRSTSTYELHA